MATKIEAPLLSSSDRQILRDERIRTEARVAVFQTARFKVIPRRFAQRIYEKNENVIVTSSFDRWLMRTTDEKGEKLEPEDLAIARRGEAIRLFERDLDNAQNLSRKARKAFIKEDKRRLKEIQAKLKNT